MIVRSDGNTLPLKDVSKGKDISTLLQQGWQPLRETPMGGQGKDYAWSLLILDLRGNPGGRFEIAVQAAQRFLAAGVMIVTTQGQIGGHIHDYNKTYHGDRTRRTVASGPGLSAPADDGR